MRAIGIAITLLLVLVQATAAFAHAALVKSEPADGAVLGQAPARLILTFSEPVSPLVMRLIRPDGQSLDPSVTAENATITVALPPLGRGTHILSWRVSSADGHPIGGTALFSVGAPTQAPQAGSTDTADGARPAVRRTFYRPRRSHLRGLPRTRTGAAGGAAWQASPGDGLLWRDRHGHGTGRACGFLTT